LPARQLWFQTIKSFFRGRRHRSSWEWRY
jgi:hypothetical protein